MAAGGLCIGTSAGRRFGGTLVGRPFGGTGAPLENVDPSPASCKMIDLGWFGLTIPIANADGGSVQQGVLPRTAAVKQRGFWATDKSNSLAGQSDSAWNKTS